MKSSRERRKKLRLSQEALAHEAGVHRNIIGRLERGIYNPSVLTLLSIAHRLEVRISISWRPRNGVDDRMVPASQAARCAERPDEPSGSPITEAGASLVFTPCDLLD